MNPSSIRDANRQHPAMPRRRFLGLAGAAGALAAHPSASLAASQRMPGADRPYQFRFALNTGTIRGQKLRLPEQIDVVAQAGYDGIEPWTGDLGEYAQSGGSLADLRKRCEDRGLKVVSAIGFAPWVVDDDAQRARGLEQLKREMDHLSQVGGTHIAAPPAGANRPGVKIDLDRAAERYRAILELGRGLGVIPQVEVWGSSANLSQVAEALYVAARTGHPDACVLADAFHMYKAGTEPAALRLLGRQAVHCFHMNDYPAMPPREAIRDAERVWPGDGVAPLAQILRILADNHCRVFLSLELFNPEYWKLPALEAARTGLAKMKASVESAGLAAEPTRGM
ncbi:MAG TPA: sugar phosphate isomerase/epimerase family protein [Candidatus Paceibacterota bacterium]|nr:sugar phosphate isomerase/epimerase family protein [Verrucomicrobiota bacterium]HRZ47679.1 sugar phosphate isomerase/epimerase family protein [Candidatus Paceibacterota bacterium]